MQMGANLAKQTTASKVPISDIPLKKDQIDLITEQDMASEFNKIYLNSREKLHAMMENPSEDLMDNVSKHLKQNSKSLSECLNEMKTYQDDIVDMVTERLAFNQQADDNDDYNVPGTDYKHVNSFISSGNSYSRDDHYKSEEPQ